MVNISKRDYMMEFDDIILNIVDDELVEEDK